VLVDCQTPLFLILVLIGTLIIGFFFLVTRENKNIQICIPYEGPEKIYIGNGQGLPIQSSGSSYFSAPQNPEFSLALHQLLHVRTITKNLNSISKFAKDNSISF